MSPRAQFPWKNKSTNLHMSDITETKMIRFSDSLLIFQTENSDTHMNHLNDIASKIFENLQYLRFLYLDHPHIFVELFLQLRDH